jgi:hypothetical protein
MGDARVIKATEDTFRQLDEGSMGVCVNCLYAQDGCEPDARGYSCEGCMDETGKSNRFVYGASELLLMGRLVIVDDADDENVKY